MAAIVIADASPRIALARVNGITWLRALFTEVLVADAVLRDVLTGQFPDTDERMQAGLTDGWLKPVAVQATEPALPDLDEGEAASIRLALEHGGEVQLAGHCRRDRHGTSTRADQLSAGGVCRTACQRFSDCPGGDPDRAGALRRVTAR